jgi:hypothetical protein
VLEMSVFNAAFGIYIHADNKLKPGVCLLWLIMFNYQDSNIFST